MVEPNPAIRRLQLHLAALVLVSTLPLLSTALLLPAASGPGFRLTLVAVAALIPFLVGLIGARLVASVQKVNGERAASQASEAQYHAQQATHDELRACGARYRALFDAITDPIFVTEVLETGLAGRTLESNAAGRDLLGVTKEELARRPLASFLDKASNPHVSELRAEIQRAGRVSFQVLARRADGDLVPLEGSACFARINDVQVMILIVRDVSERRWAEAEQATMLAKLIEAHERLEALSRALVDSQERERRAVARELHDEVGQVLTALAIQLDLAEAADGDAGGLCVDPIRAARRLVGGLIEQTRRISLDLRPTMLDDLGLEPALAWLFERYTSHTAVRVEFAHQGLDRRFPTATETAAFRIVQEALTNVARHSGAPLATVSVSAAPGGLAIEITDRGHGFTAARGPGTSSGLHGMAERAKLLGGTFEVQTGPGGTSIFVHLPIAEAT